MANALGIYHRHLVARHLIPLSMRGSEACCRDMAVKVSLVLRGFASCCRRYGHGALFMRTGAAIVVV